MRCVAMGKGVHSFIVYICVITLIGRLQEIVYYGVVSATLYVSTLDGKAGRSTTPQQLDRLSAVRYDQVSVMKTRHQTLHYLAQYLYIGITH